MNTQGQQGQDTTSGQAQATPSDVTNTATQPVDENQAKIDKALSEAQESWKKEISGLNRANSELQKKLQEKELEGMKAEERVKKELELAQAEKDKILKETITLKKTNAVVSKGLDPNFANLISGTTDEEIASSIATIVGNIEREVAKRFEAKQKEIFGLTPPSGGQAPGNKTMKRADFDKVPEGIEKSKIAREYKIID